MRVLLANLEEGGSENGIIELLESTRSPFIDSGLEEGTTYYYKIRTVTTSGTSDYSNKISGKTTPGQTSQDFLITSESNRFDIEKNNSESVIITVNGIDGFTGTVNLSANSTPAGLSLSLNPVSVTLTESDPTKTAELTINSSNELGNFSIIVKGKNNGITKQVELMPTIVDELIPPTTFDVQGSTSTMQLSKSNAPTETRTITIQGSGGFSGNVNLSTSPANSDFTASINPTSVSLSQSNPSPNAVLTVTFVGNPTVASSVKVIATDGSATKTLTIPVNGGCLIATAAYGSPLAAEVQMLREIRDTQLLQTESGTSFMQNFNAFYYTFSPTVAQWERDYPVFKEMVKTTITPLITSLSILQHVDINSESEMLFYGISLIMLNIGMYFVAPVVVIFKIKNMLVRSEGSQKGMFIG